MIVVGVAGALVFGGVLAHRWLTRSPRFAIDEITVTGQRLLSTSALGERLGIGEQPNIFGYDVDAGIGRLERSPWVRSAEIRRVLPDALTVDIDERVPAALALIEQLYLVDTDGTPFKRATAGEAAELGLVVISGLDRSKAAAEAESTRARLADALALADLWRGSESRPALAEINLDSARGYTLISAAGAVAIRLGAGEPAALERRLALFDRAWASLDADERARARFIHLDQSAEPRRVAVALHSQPTSSDSEHLDDSETVTWAN